MRGEPSNLKIVGVALMLFSSVLLGVGIHHMVQTGTCSSTGYSANYGPVPHCPPGTGWWFAFLFGGIIGGVAGALIAGTLSLVFASIFGAIGVGSLTVAFDAHAQSGEKLFAGIFGGCFAIVGIASAFVVLSSAVEYLRGGGRTVRTPVTGAAARANLEAALSSRTGTSSKAGRAQTASAFGSPQAASAFGTPQATSAFGNASTEADPIMSAYTASSPPATGARAAPSAATAQAAKATPMDLVAGLQAAAQRAAAKAPGAQDPADELGKLAALHEKGALTDAEFASAKAKLLGQM